VIKVGKGDDGGGKRGRKRGITGGSLMREEFMVRRIGRGEICLKDNGHRVWSQRGCMIPRPQGLQY